MVSPVELKLQQRIEEYNSMSKSEQLRKLEQVLLVYAKGDEHVVEGFKLTYFAIVSFCFDCFSVDGWRGSVDVFLLGFVYSLCVYVCEDWIGCEGNDTDSYP